MKATKPLVTIPALWIYQASPTSPMPRRTAAGGRTVVPLRVIFAGVIGFALLFYTAVEALSQ